MAGEVERAVLTANIDALMAWKKIVELRHNAMIDWQNTIIKTIKELAEAAKTTIEGCEILVQTDTQLMMRTDNIDKRIDIVKERIDIVNKRIRFLENAVERLMPR